MPLGSEEGEKEEEGMGGRGCWVFGKGDESKDDERLFPKRSGLLQIRSD